MNAATNAVPPSAGAGVPVVAVRRPSAWRHAAVVLGVALGLSSGFYALFNASLPFFLLPLGQEFGWGRGDTAAATVLAMLGVTLASPFVGRLFDRFGPERVIGVSVLLLAAGLHAMSWLPPSLWVLGALCLAIGVGGCATTMIGYASVLPRWFDQRLGLALGVAGLGIGVGVGVTPFLATGLIADLGWRRAYAVLAVLALVLGLLAWVLLRPRRGELPPGLAAQSGSARAADLASLPGLTLRQSARDGRFWLLLVLTFLVPFSILGIALHGAALFLDRGLTGQQAATGAALAGLGAIIARVVVGVLLDRFHAPWIAAVVFIAGATGLAVNSHATQVAWLCLGTFLGGAAMGAEGDLLPFMVRRYFGLRAFGAVFGVMHAVYALGGVLGPIAYGYTYDRLGTYGPLMLACAALCTACAAAVGGLGAYRYRAIGPAAANEP